MKKFVGWPVIASGKRFNTIWNVIKDAISITSENELYDKHKIASYF